MDDGLVTAIQTHDVSVSLLIKMVVFLGWDFYNAYPVKYAVSDLKAQESEIVIESLELAYTYFEITEDTSISNLFD